MQKLLLGSKPEELLLLYSQGIVCVNYMYREIELIEYEDGIPSSLHGRRTTFFRGNLPH